VILTYVSVISIQVVVMTARGMKNWSTASNAVLFNMKMKSCIQPAEGQPAELLLNRKE
jgi:hypothetical protein